MAASDRDLSATMQGGSDAMYDFHCDPCSTDGENLKATGYCQRCGVYLCANCYKDHRKNPASRNHQLLDAATMPRTGISAEPSDGLTDKVATSKEYKDIVTGMDSLVAMSTVENTFINREDKDNDAFRTRVVANIRSGRNEMDKLLDDAEARAIQKVDELHKQNAEKLKSASQQCETVLSEATTVATDLGEKARTGKNKRLFVEVKQAESRLPAMEKEINELKARKISQYKFDKDNIVKHFKSSLSAMFSVTVTQDSADIKARHVVDIDVKAEDDSDECFITGIVALSEDRLVVTDYTNRAVKLVDLKLKKVVSRSALSSQPVDVTKTLKDQIAVGLGQENKIEIFTVTDILTRTKKIDAGIGFSSLCYDVDRFFMLDQDTRAVKIVDMTGRIVSKFCTGSDIDPLFKKPSQITLRRSEDIMYIADEEANTVTCMTQGGRVIWVYKHADLQRPRGVAVSREGDVIVCSNNLHAVQLVSRSGQFVQVLLDQQRGLATFPMAIAVFDDTLWLGSSLANPENANHVGMFKLE